MGCLKLKSEKFEFEQLLDWEAVQIYEHRAMGEYNLMRVNIVRILTDMGNWAGEVLE